MIALQVTSTAGRFHYQDRLTIGGTSVTSRWDDGGERPGHGHPEITQLDWAPTVAEALYDRYVKGMKSRRLPLGDPIIEHHDRPTPRGAPHGHESRPEWP